MRGTASNLGGYYTLKLTKNSLGAKGALDSGFGAISYILTDLPIPKKGGYYPRQPGIKVKTLKGGSFLCSDNYCQRFRPAARQAQDVTLGSSHIGFRTAK